jgi:hypothetical protein
MRRQQSRPLRGHGIALRRQLRVAEAPPREFSQSRFAHDFSRVPVHLQRTPEDPKPQAKPKAEPTKPTKPKAEKKPKRQNVVILGEGWKGSTEWSRVIGGKIIRVTSVAAAAEALKKIDAPIGTLYFVTHSTSLGQLKFGNAEKYVAAKDIAAKLTATVSAENAPEIVDFRGCSVGTTPKAMDDIRIALGAQSVLAGNCFTVISRSESIKIADKPVREPSDVAKKNEALFAKLAKGTKANFGDAEKCIVNPTQKGYFKAGGHFVSVWFNPTFTADFDPKQSVCFKDAKRQEVDPAQAAAAAAQSCQIIEVDASRPATQPTTRPTPAP